MKTQRLSLREIQKDDINSLFTLIFDNANVVQYTFGKEKIAKKDLYDYVKKIGLQVLEKNDTKEIVGLAGLLACCYQEYKGYEFGFILAEKFWGYGYASEIGKAQIQFIKDTLKEKKALALAHPNNLASIKCIEKLGLSYKATLQSDRGERLLYQIDF